MSIRKKRNFMTLYQPVHAQFERFCKARAYGEMEFQDLMQETVVVAFEKFDELLHKDRFLYFLFGISTRILSNANRKKSEAPWHEKFDDYASILPSIEKELEIEDLYKAMSLLPENQREALILFEISGFTIREIASIQSSSEDAIKQRLSRGRKTLILLLKSKEQYSQNLAR